MDILVAIIALAGLVFSWRKVAKKLAGKLWVIRHFAGALSGVFVFFFVVGMSLAVGIIEPAKTTNKQQNVTQAAEEQQPVNEKPEFEYEKMTLAQYMAESKGDRREIAEEFVDINEFPESAEVLFHKCFSYMSRNKSNELTIGKIAEWCLHDYNNDQKAMARYVDYDAFESQFSPLDGMHYKSSAFIETNMNDPDSFDHIETRYRLVVTDKERHAITYTTFRGRNGFGGMVKQTIVLQTNIETGDVIQVIE